MAEVLEYLRLLVGPHEILLGVQGDELADAIDVAIPVHH